MEKKPDLQQIEREEPDRSVDPASARVSRRRFLAYLGTGSAALAAGTAGLLTGANSAGAEEQGARKPNAAGDGRGVRFEHWPEDEGERLAKLVEKFAGSDRYAVFDADNTIWRYDLEESLLPLLEMKGVLRPDTIDPSLRLIPFRDGESLYSYYVRLCEIDDKVCYPWIAQVFSGLTLARLETYVDELYARDKPIPVTYYDGEDVVHDTVDPPRIYPGQRELIRTLQEHEITAYVMTAAHEELVRMVVSDPEYGLDVPPENVIGVTTLLKDPDTGRLTTARKLIEEGIFGDVYGTDAYRRQVVTPYLWTPATFYVGKQAAIIDYISNYERPVLVAGDSPNDWYMLFYSEVNDGGARVWVNRDQGYTDDLMAEMEDRAGEQKAAGVAVDAERGWLVVKPEEIGV